MEERFEIKPGAMVFGVDGEIGQVERVIVDPSTDMVTGLVVRKGLLRRRDIVIPIGAVERADDEIVRVGFMVEEANGLPEYREEDYVAPPADWQPPGGQSALGFLFRLSELLAPRGLRPARAEQVTAAAGGRPIKAGQKVACRDGEAGKIDLVLLDPASRRATHFVVRRGVLLGRDTIIPVELVREVGRDRVYLDVTCERLAELPEYRPDGEITDDVLDALWEGSGLDQDDLICVKVQTRDGIVELSGETSTEETRAAIEAVARRVRGVLGVRNRLRTFEALAKARSEPQPRDGDQTAA